MTVEYTYVSLLLTNSISKYARRNCDVMIWHTEVVKLCDIKPRSHRIQRRNATQADTALRVDACCMCTPVLVYDKCTVTH